MPNNLPVQLTSFVGRDRELTELGELLESTRLLTLTGAGGCGKTRLALQLAADAVDRYPGGTCWLELAPLSDPALIESALATMLGVRPLPGRTPVEAAVFELAPRRALVLLDNCEHVLEPCGRLAGALLRGCPDVTIVATSREPLGLGGETTWRVPSLGPSDAERLFIERAVKVRSHFAVAEDSAHPVAQICEDLDGIPLAIELAAAPERTLLRRLGVFHGGFTLDACEAVCADDELDRYAVLDVLTSLVDKSLVLVEERESRSRYALLETIRHYALERLAETGETGRLRDRHPEAFRAVAESTAPILGTDAGSGDVLGADAANLYAAIEHTAQVEPEKALRLCAALSYWWLLTGRLVEGPAALSRALEATVGQRSSLRCNVLFWRGYLAFFAADYELTQQAATEALALAHELGDRPNEARILNLLGLLETGPDPRASLPMFERSGELAQAVSDNWCLSEATQNIGWALVMAGEHDAARTKLEASFEIARRHGLRELVAWHWFMLGHAAYPTGDRDTARALWERCLDGASDLQEGWATWSLGLLDVDAGRPAEALERLEPCRRRMVSAGVGHGLPFLDDGIALADAALGRLDEARDGLIAAAQEHASRFVWAQAMALGHLAQVERLRGDHAAAEAAAEQALAVAEHLGHRGLVARARHQLARVAVVRRDWTAAEQLAHEALVDQSERGDHLDVPDSLDVLAEIAAELDSHQEAARLLGAAGRARAELGLARWQTEQQHAEALTRRLREALGDDALTKARSEGEALSLDEVVAYVRRARGTRKRPPGGWESLTPTELEIVRHAAAGLTNPEISERMFISRGTVKIHLSHIYAKLGLRNRSEVAAEAMRRRSAGPV